MSDIRGKTIGTVFQDPMSALTSVYTVGDQIAEAIEVHQRDVGWRAARARAVELLELVGIAQPERRARSSRTNCPAGNANAWSSRSRSRSPTTPTC